MDCATRLYYSPIFSRQPKQADSLVISIQYSILKRGGGGGSLSLFPAYYRSAQENIQMPYRIRKLFSVIVKCPDGMDRGGQILKVEKSRSPVS